MQLNVNQPKTEVRDRQRIIRGYTQLALALGRQQVCAHGLSGQQKGKKKEGGKGGKEGRKCDCGHFRAP